jgi:hypothetical protein
LKADALRPMRMAVKGENKHEEKKKQADNHDNPGADGDRKSNIGFQ